MSENTYGWIKLYRQLLDNYLWNEKPFSKGQAWIDLLLIAEPKDTKIIYKNECILLKRGTVNRSILQLSKRWGWSREKTKNFLKILESDKMLTTKATTHRTTITLIKYEDFQGCHTTNLTTNLTTSLTTSRQQADSKPTTDIEHNNIYNKYKRENITRARTREDTLTLGRFQNVFLTQSEIDELKAKYPNEYTAKIERLSRYLTNSGKTYANHFAVLTDWLEKDTSTMKKEKTKSSASYDIAEYERSMFDD